MYLFWLNTYIIHTAIHTTYKHAGSLMMISMCQRHRLARASFVGGSGGYIPQHFGQHSLRYHLQVHLRLRRLPSYFLLASSKLCFSPLPRSAKLAPRIQDVSLLLNSAKLCSSHLPSSPVQEGILTLKSFHCHAIRHLT